MATDDITFIEIDSRDLLEIVIYLSVADQVDAPASASHYRNLALNRLWSYVTPDLRAQRDEHIETKAYLGPSKLILDSK